MRGQKGIIVLTGLLISFLMFCVLYRTLSVADNHLRRKEVRQAESPPSDSVAEDPVADSPKPETRNWNYRKDLPHVVTDERVREMKARRRLPVTDEEMKSIQRRGAVNVVRALRSSIEKGNDQVVPTIEHTLKRFGEIGIEVLEKEIDAIENPAMREALTDVLTRIR